MLLSINTNIVNKPADKSRHGTPFNSVDLTVDELIHHITEGHAYSAQFRGAKRKSENFVATGILAVDIDRGMTLAEAIELPYLKFFASFIHTTATHTDQNNRFRIVFELEEPITDAVQYRKAITGLIDKFGGDRSTKDAARFFYGNTRALVHHFNKRLSTEEVYALVAISNTDKWYGGGLATRDNPTIHVSAPFGISHLVTRSDGVSLPLSEVTPDNRTIHCPFHPDKHPSALVVRSRCGGGRGVHCHSCATTSWVGSGYGEPEPEWHTHYQKAAEMQDLFWPDDGESAGSGPYHVIAKDGTEVWLSDSKYLPPLTIRPGVTYIRSPKGSGKTEQLAGIVSHLKAKGKKILLVGHRRLLLNNLAARLGIESYLKRKARDGMDTSGCLAISLESLPRYVQPSEDKFDVIMIDESEQVVSHFTSKTMTGKRLASRALLEHLIQKAEYVVCADADIGLLTSGLVYMMRNQDHPDHLILNRFQRGRSGANDGATNEISIYSGEGALLDLLQEDVAAGKRCFVATNSKTLADRIKSQLKGLHPDLRILLITRETSSLVTVKRFTAQPAVECLKYDVMICSPALSTGVDITFADGASLIDGVYGFFREDITTHFEIDQQLSRVRNPGKIGVWISPRTGPWETDPSVILAELQRNRDMTETIVGYTKEGEPKHVDDSILTLIAWILSTRRASLRNLKSLFVDLRSSNGWQIRQVDTSSPTRLRRHVLDQEFAEMIVSAKDLDQLEYDMQRSLFNSHRGVELESLAGIKRFELKKAYNVNGVSLDLVQLHDDGCFLEKFNNLKLLYASTHDLVGPNNVLPQDIRDVRSTELASVDWINQTRKKLLLTQLLTSTGLLCESGVFSFTTPVSKQSLGSFAYAVELNRADLESLFGMAVRSDLHKKPVIQLREVLKIIGLSLTKMVRIRMDSTRTDNYYLDEGRWMHVVTTCGLSRDHIDRQLAANQVVMA